MRGEGLIEAVLTTLFPPQCAACGRRGREPFCALCELGLEPAPSFQIAGARLALARFAFGGPIATSIHHLKYHARPELARTLGRTLSCLLPELGEHDVVVPIPLSPRRLRTRGYNQAVELARVLPLRRLARALTRAEAHEQVGLSKQARLENPRGSIRGGSESVRDLRVLVLDDVVTTGATAEAAVSTLLEAGARSVSVLAVARTP